MSNYLTFISRSLAVKLIVAIVLLILVGGGISWYALIHAGRENLVNEAVKDAAAYSELIHKSISIAVEVLMEKDLPPVLIDRDQVKQALTNLITNAIDAMPRAGP